MTVAGDILFVAGPPDVVDERQAFHHPDDPEVQARLHRQTEAYEGRAGGQLWAMATSDGHVTDRYALNTIPVFDGIAAAGSNLYMATIDGQIMCLAGNGKAPLRKIDDNEPIRNAWDQSEDAGYLLPVGRGQAKRRR